MRDPIVQKCTEDILDRIAGVQNDLKAFIYIRKHNLQHEGTPDNIGGGNIVVALSLFTALNFLGKTYYCVKRPDKFNDDGSAKNETETFLHFMRFIQRSGLDLGLSGNGEILELVWSGFRDYLAHRLTVEPGKAVLTFEFKPGHGGSIEDIMAKAKTHKVFEDDGNNRNWIVNGDSLLSNLQDITQLTVDFLLESENVNTELLLNVIGTEYP